MDEAQIKAIIKSQGYAPRIRETVSRKANGTTSVAVYAFRDHHTGRSLGKLSDVIKLSDEDLRKLIASKFAEQKSEVH